MGFHSVCHTTVTELLLLLLRNSNSGKKAVTRHPRISPVDRSVGRPRSVGRSSSVARASTSAPHPPPRASPVRVATSRRHSRSSESNRNRTTVQGSSIASDGVGNAHGKTANETSANAERASDETRRRGVATEENARGDVCAEKKSESVGERSNKTREYGR